MESFCRVRSFPHYSVEALRPLSTGSAFPHTAVLVAKRYTGFHFVIRHRTFEIPDSIVARHLIGPRSSQPLAALFPAVVVSLAAPIQPVRVLVVVLADEHFGDNPPLPERVLVVLPLYMIYLPAKSVARLTIPIRGNLRQLRVFRDSRTLLCDDIV